MKVVFVTLGQEQLGISILSVVLRRAGHETSLVFDLVLFHDRHCFDIPMLRDLFNRATLIYEWQYARHLKRIAARMLRGNVLPKPPTKRRPLPATDATWDPAPERARAGGLV